MGESMTTETLYKKVGRKYVPVSVYWAFDYRDEQKTGTFRLIYAYEDGARTYEYNVTPSTASFEAAAMVARVAMEEKMREMAKMRPQTPTKYTKKQLDAIKKFREEMGGLFPEWWTETSSYEIAQAGIDAVRNYRP
jgi:hypothetical protein